MMIYKNYFCLILMFISTIYAFPLFAWNAEGHVLIAEIAYDHLTPQTKNIANRLAKNIYRQLPQPLQTKLNREFPRTPIFAKISVLPDVWHEETVRQVFQTVNAPIPYDFLSIANESSSHWHYINFPHSDPNNVISALNKMNSDLKKSQNENTSALLMIYIEHLTGDIHQPTHNMLSGNDYCLWLKANGECKKNLHTLWDSGVSFLKPHANIQKMAVLLQKAYPQQDYIKQIQTTSPNHWSAESHQYANFVYSTKKYQKPSRNYDKQGQTIAKERLTLAAYRLVNELNQDLNN